MRKNVAVNLFVGPCMILALFMVLGVTTHVFADPPCPSSSGPVPSQVTSGSAMMGFIDPETGALRAPTEEELSEMGALADESQGAARIEPRLSYREDGSVGVFLGRSSLEWIRVQRGSDGRMNMGHDFPDQTVHSRAQEDR